MKPTHEELLAYFTKYGPKEVADFLGKSEGHMSEFNSVKSSGEKDTFVTGAVRDKRAGKGRYDLVSPVGMRRRAKHYENGITSGGYAPRNWEKGIPLHNYIDSTLRHIFKYIEDRIRGRKPEEDHLAAASWNLDGAMHTEELIAAGELPDELDDITTEKAPAEAEGVSPKGAGTSPPPPLDNGGGALPHGGYRPPKE